MPNPNALISTTVRLDPPLDRAPGELLEREGGVSVELEGRRARLDPADERSAGFAQVLDGLGELGMPVYVEVDPATDAVTRVLVPTVSPVVSVRPGEEGVLDVELEASHARHRLRLGGPDAGELERQLRDAAEAHRPVIVVEDDAHEIIDVSGFTPDPERPLPLPPPPAIPPSGPSAVMRTLVAVNRSRVVQSAGVLRKPINRLVWGVLEARLVRETAPFLLNTLRSSRTPRRYHLKSNGSVFYLRHHTGDVAIFRKFAAYRYYDFPQAVADRLRGASISVVDLGANIGLFGVHARCYADVATMVSFEPDEENAAVLERVIAEYGGSWKLVKACASNRDGEARFAGGRANLSRIADEGEVVVPVVDAIPYLVAADLAKVNIEGAEWDILADERFVAQSPPVLILEYHKIANPEPEIHSLALRLLSAAGYSWHEFVYQSEENALIWGLKDGSGEASASG